MNLSNSTTRKNLEASFAYESKGNRTYLFFAELCRQLGLADLAKLFQEIAAQETQHGFAHFALLHPEFVVKDPAALSEAQKKEIAAQCLKIAIENETYEYTTMYPQFMADAKRDRDEAAALEFQAQAEESSVHAAIFREAAHHFGLLADIEHFHAERYTEALQVLEGGEPARRVASSAKATRKWICKQCGMIYDPIVGDPDSGIAPGTPFEAIPEDWHCPLCGAAKKTFILLEEKVAA